MDITVVSTVIEPDPRYLNIFRSALGEDSAFWYGGNPDPAVESTNLMRLPKETLTIRAAEYNLAEDDPKVLDLVMLEHLALPEEVGMEHPLFYADTVKDALKAMEGVLDNVRLRHGKPRDAKYLASAKKNVSRGLTRGIELFHANTDAEVVEPVKFIRDKQREWLRKNGPGQLASVGEVLRRQHMSHIQNEAHNEHRQREDRERIARERQHVD